jgi:hypothetical protein
LGQFLERLALRSAEVHLRRALLLFAIVLGLAAVAASVSRTDRTRPAPSPPSAGTTTETAGPGTDTTPGPDPGTRTLSFDQAGRRQVRKLAVGQAATVVVKVAQAGQVEIQELGGVRPAEPATPASFDIFGDRPGRFPVIFHPGAGGPVQRVGVLRVVAR